MLAETIHYVHSVGTVSFHPELHDDKIMTNSNAELWHERQQEDNTANEVTPSKEEIEKLDLATPETIEPTQPSLTDIYCPDCEMWLQKKVVEAPIALPDREKKEVANTYGHSDSGARWEHNIQFFDEKWRKNKKTEQMKLIEANRAKCYSCHGAEGMKIHCQECLNLYCHKCLNPKRDLCIFCTSFSPQTCPQPTASPYHERSYGVNNLLYGHPEHYETEEPDEDYNHSPDYEPPDVPQEVFDRWEENAEKEEQEKNEQKFADEKEKDNEETIDIERGAIMGKCWQQMIQEYNASHPKKNGPSRAKCHMNHQVGTETVPNLRDKYMNNTQMTATNTGLKEVTLAESTDNIATPSTLGLKMIQDGARNCEAGCLSDDVPCPFGCEITWCKKCQQK